MQRKINWKNVSITMLAASNLLLVNRVSTIEDTSDQTATIEMLNNQVNELETTIYDLRNELVILDEEAATWYSLYTDALDNLYTLETESGLYNEYPSEQVSSRNPNNKDLNATKTIAEKVYIESDPIIKTIEVEKPVYIKDEREIDHLKSINNEQQETIVSLKQTIDSLEEDRDYWKEDALFHYHELEKLTHKQ